MSSVSQRRGPEVWIFRNQKLDFRKDNSWLRGRGIKGDITHCVAITEVVTFQEQPPVDNKRNVDIALFRLRVK